MLYKNEEAEILYIRDCHGVVRETCPSCGMHYLRNPYRKTMKIKDILFPYCPWCGQKIKEREQLCYGRTE